MSASAAAPRAYPLAAVYRRPAALDEPAARHVRAVHAWLDPEPLADDRAHRFGRRLPPGLTGRYAVRRAYVAEVGDGHAWVTETLARGVAPLAGVQLVDGLRALRGVAP